MAIGVLWAMIEACVCLIRSSCLHYVSTKSQSKRGIWSIICQPGKKIHQMLQKLHEVQKNIVCIIEGMNEATQIGLHRGSNPGPPASRF